MANHSKKYNLVRTYYKGGFWSKRQVENAVKKGWITASEYEEITGESYPQPEVEEEAPEETAPYSRSDGFDPAVSIAAAEVMKELNAEEVCVNNDAESVSEESVPDSEE